MSNPRIIDCPPPGVREEENPQLGTEEAPLLRPDGSVIRCPNWPESGAQEHVIDGCGSAHVSGPDREGLFDCLECGIWFRWEDRDGQRAACPETV